MTYENERAGNRDTSDYKVLGRRDLFLDPSVRLKATHGLLLKELKKGERYSLSSLFSLVLDQ
ncbi:LOW QUALITY PROTEIN: uncharacterized protein LOC108851097 [Raphanus sativus]|uniref:LOW QUALITY PROTEIN: uncharacterized protein LOC108851097 n=1 Tax=Raphanus sativus TaxID=3726 RepID=A0A6J0N5Y0_RAPSA|nr:LOW QUALITY PROTEIN: uncharacterized protein LOC108851097 [Raphanus sativus]